jgi:hypothetical protein
MRENIARFGLSLSRTSRRSKIAYTPPSALLTLGVHQVPGAELGETGTVDPSEDEATCIQCARDARKAPSDLLVIRPAYCPNASLLKLDPGR